MNRADFPSRWNREQSGPTLARSNLAKWVREGKDMRDVRTVLDLTRRVSTATRRLQDQRAVKGQKDHMRRYVWRLV